MITEYLFWVDVQNLSQPQKIDIRDNGNKYWIVYNWLHRERVDVDSLISLENIWDRDGSWNITTHVPWDTLVLNGNGITFNTAITTINNIWLVIRPTPSADDVSLVTEKAIRDAIDAAILMSVPLNWSGSPEWVIDSRYIGDTYIDTDSEVKYWNPVSGANTWRQYDQSWPA